MSNAPKKPQGGMPMGGPHGPRGMGPRQPINKKVLLRVLSYLKPYWPRLLVVFFCIVLDAIATASAATFLGTLIDDYIVPLLADAASGIAPVYTGLLTAILKMAGLYLLAVVAVVFVLALFIMRSASPLFKKLQKLLDRMTTILLENITGVRVVRAFNNETREEQRMGAAFANYAQTSIKANRRFANLDGLSFLFINLFVVIVYWLSGGRISSGNLQIGDITAVIGYALMVLFFLMMAQMVILTMPRALECCGRVQAVLEHTPEIQDSVSDSPKTSGGHGEEVLAFRDVSFRFADAEENTLSHLNFVCKRGETTAIIGGTGSGKSTVASLILRFHDVTSGSVCLNGTDIRQMTQRYLRDHLAYVQQKAWLFSGTIADNLRYSRKNATEEELMHAADVAQAGDFIRSLPDGLNSYVAHGGTNFSGGQKQRLSIACALVHGGRILILDDSASALDFATDAKLRAAIRKLSPAPTTFIVSQRAASVMFADFIIVLDEGRAVGQGTHEELLRNCAVYREIYASQFPDEAAKLSIPNNTPEGDAAK